MKSKHRNLIVVVTFLLLAGCFVVIAQEKPGTRSDTQKIGDLEQEVTNLQNEIRILQNNAGQQLVNEEIAAPRPESDTPDQPVSNEPSLNSVYSVQPPAQPVWPPNNGATRQAGYGYGYQQPLPTPPWVVDAPTYSIPTPVTQFVPVQVPVYVETSPCWIDYGPVYDSFFPSPVGLNFWFGGGGRGNCHHDRD
jgi:hypothetical protein